MSKQTKITVKPDTRRIDVESIRPGGMFCSYGSEYMRIVDAADRLDPDSVWAVRLEDGELEAFRWDEQVLPREAEIILA